MRKRFRFRLVLDPDYVTLALLLYASMAVGLGLATVALWLRGAL